MEKLLNELSIKKIYLVALFGHTDATVVECFYSVVYMFILPSLSFLFQIMQDPF